jgi:hypothetical protein
MNMTTGKRTSDGGSTELTIADGLIYIDIFRRNIHVEQRIYDAADLMSMDLDAALLAGTSSRLQRFKSRKI